MGAGIELNQVAQHDGCQNICRVVYVVKSNSDSFIPIRSSRISVSFFFFWGGGGGSSSTGSSKKAAPALALGHSGSADGLPTELKEEEFVSQLRGGGGVVEFRGFRGSGWLGL